MKWLKFDGALINTDAIDMIYCDDDANMFVKYGEKQASILLRSGQKVYVGMTLEEVEKIFTETADLPTD